MHLNCSKLMVSIIGIKYVNRLFIRNNSNITYKKSVIISKSEDIFTNLAFEDWLYKNHNFTQNHVLMLWKNKPCIVIGRHQNPWLEANVKNGILIARRNSGGGTVYHDLGNLNLTFFTPKINYNRKSNLDLICKVLKEKFGINSEVNKREDLVVNERKISGTAAKLGRNNAYHHCTVLIDANKDNLKHALNGLKNIETNATSSVKSPTLNLKTLNADITVDNLLLAVAEEYLNNKTLTGVENIDPKESDYLGLDQIRKDLSSWDWIYGKTPKFKINKNLDVALGAGQNIEFNLKFLIEKGKVSDWDVSGSNSFSLEYYYIICEIANKYNYQQFSLELFDVVENDVKTLINENKKLCNS